MKTLIMALVLFLTACAGAGTKFSIADANRVHNGMTREEVISVMGVKPYSIQDQGKTFIWSYGYYNGFTGANESRACPFKFGDDGKTYGIPDGGMYGDIQQYQN